MWAARRWSPAVGGVDAAVVGLNPLLTAAAVEARPYALATLAVVLSLYGLDRLRASRRPRTLALCLVAGLVAVSLQGMLARALIVISPLLLAGVRHGRARRDGTVVYGGLVVVAGAGLLVTSLPERAPVAGIPRPSPLASVADLAGGALGERGLYLAALAALALVALASGYASELRARWRPTLLDVAPFIVWRLVPGAIPLAVPLVHPLFVTRYATESAPGLGLPVGGPVAHAPHSVSARFAPRVVAGLGAVALATSLLVGPAPIAGNAYLVAHAGGGVVVLGSPTLVSAPRTYEAGNGSLHFWPFDAPPRDRDRRRHWAPGLRPRRSGRLGRRRPRRLFPPASGVTRRARRARLSPDLEDGTAPGHRHSVVALTGVVIRR